MTYIILAQLCYIINNQVSIPSYYQVEPVKIVFCIDTHENFLYEPYNGKCFEGYVCKTKKLFIPKQRRLHNVK